MINLAQLTNTCRTHTLAFADAVRANPTLAAITMEGFLTRLGFGMVGFTLPLYALALGMNFAEVSLLYVLRTVTTLAVKPAMGWAADRFGRKSTLVVAVILRCLVGLLFVFANQPWHLFAIRILHGAMTAARDPSASALIAEHGNPRHMASTFAWYSTARDIGRSLGYAVAGLLIQLTGSYQIAFLVAFLTSCAALFTVIRYVREGKEDQAGRKAKSSERPTSTPAQPVDEHLPWSVYRGLLGYAFFGLMVAGSAEMMRGLFPVIATQHAALTEGQAGLIVGVASIAVLVAGPAFGWLSDRVDRRLVLGVRSLTNTVSSLLYLALPGFSGYFVARMMDDTGKAAFRPTWGALLAEASEAHPRHRARVMTFMDTAYTLGEVLGPLVAGLLISGFGVPVMLGVRAALALFTELQLHLARLSQRAQHPAPARPKDWLERVIRQRIKIAEVIRRNESRQADWFVRETYRDAAIVLLLWKAGLSASEIVALDVADVDTSRSGCIVAKVRACDGHEAHDVGLPADVADALNAWLAVRPQGGRALFLNASKRRITRRTIERAVARMGNEAAVLVEARSNYKRNTLEVLTALTPERLRQL